MSTKWFFLRGLVREGGHWAGFLERFEAANPGTGAVALDIPGAGRRWQEKSPLSVNAMAEAVREEFLRVRAEKNHLFALSLGGMIGIEWLSRWPLDFQSAALVNTSVRGLSPFVKRLLPANYPAIARMILSRSPALMEKTILEMTSNRSERHADLVQSWVAIQKARPVSTMNALRQIIAASRFHPPREKPPVPVIVLNGGGDRLVSPSCSDALAHHWNLPLRRHPTAGHDLTLDEPEWVLDQLKTL